jgi:hypothetical protein
VVSADQHRERLAVGDVHEGLDDPAGRQLQEAGDLVDRLLARSRHHGERAARPGARRLPLADVGLLDVRRVVAGVTRDDRVLAGFGEHLELVRARTADRAGVGLDRAEVEAAAEEDASVRAEHALVRFARLLLGHVEGVRVFHDELAAAHEAGARAHLVAELRLDLIEVERQRAVARDVAPDHVDDDLLVGRPDEEVGALAVLEAQELRSVPVPAPALLPQLRRHRGRQQHLLRARAVHLVADDVLHLLQHPPAQRQKGVHAGGDPADETAADHEHVAHDLSVRGALLQGGHERAGKTHGSGLYHRALVSARAAARPGRTEIRYRNARRPRCADGTSVRARPTERARIPRGRFIDAGDSTFRRLAK